ncbi:MAG: type II toxin-antitoxin system death-on-curing family toxin [Anderseniella sp.]|nr:type II toxin-antitoxin system death-on-curing family toxin [Anderseniella sp.]
MTKPVWVLRSVIDAIHDMQLAQHGGASGVRDEGLLASALARPVNNHAHGETDLCTLAAAYAFGIVRNHPYVDGNKRTAFLAAYIFLRMNGLELVADEISATTVMLTLATGDSSEDEYAAWLRVNTKTL